MASALQDTRVGDAASHSLHGEPLALARGSSIGRYVVLQALGAGGMGVVYATARSPAPSAG